MKDFPDLPPVWTAFCAILIWFLGWACPVFDISGPVARTLALLFIIVGLALPIWSIIWFRRKKTTVEPRHKPKSLIVEGPYRLSRNPIYLSMLLLMLAEALWLGPLSGFIGVIFLWAVIRQRFILGEEATLRAFFGDEADRYISQTRRWL